MRSQGTGSLRRCHPHWEETEGTPGLREGEAGSGGDKYGPWVSPHFAFCLSWATDKMEPLPTAFSTLPRGFWVCCLVGSNRLT